MLILISRCFFFSRKQSSRPRKHDQVLAIHPLAGKPRPGPPAVSCLKLRRVDCLRMLPKIIATATHRDEDFKLNSTQYLFFITLGAQQFASLFPYVRINVVALTEAMSSFGHFIFSTVQTGWWNNIRADW